MRRGTTPRHTFQVDIDLTDAEVYITYAQNGSTVLEKTEENATISADKIIVELSQTDTLLFSAGVDVEIQIRYKKPNGTADASDIITVPVERILKDGAI